jgi:hypothetical protein
MAVIEHFTLQRAWHGLSDDELFWEPIAGSWGVRRRAECQTPTPFGDGDWVVDFDADLVMAAIQGNAVEPLTTIGWLMWHIGSMPERLAQLDFLGGYGAAVIAATLNEVSHHGTQICMLRDLYRITNGRVLSTERQI